MSTPFYFFEDTVSYGTNTLLTSDTDDGVGLLYSAIYVSGNKPDVETLGGRRITVLPDEFDAVTTSLLNVYGKLKKLGPDGARELIKLFPVGVRPQSLSDAEKHKILMYLYQVTPDIPIDVARAGKFDTSACVKNMQIYVDAAAINRQHKKSFFTNPDNAECGYSYGFPPIDSTRREILADIFDLESEDVWVRTIDYDKSYLLEEMLMNSLQKMCFAVKSYNIGSYDVEAGDGIENAIAKFVSAISQRNSRSFVNESLRDIVKMLQSADGTDGVWFRFIKKLADGTAEISSIDMTIDTFIREDLGKSHIRIKSLLLDKIADVCDENEESDFLRYREFLDSISVQTPEIHARNQLMCSEKLKQYLYTFRFYKNQIVSYDADTDRVHLLPNHYVLDTQTPLSDALIAKFSNLRRQLDFRQPYRKFESMVRSTWFTFEEASDLLRYVFNPVSHVCSLLASAIHHFNVQTIPFDIPQMYTYLAVMPSTLLTAPTSVDMCQYQIPRTSGGSLSTLLNQVPNVRSMVQIFDIDTLTSLVQQIRVISQNVYQLHLICAQFCVPELYIVQLVQDTMGGQMDPYDEAILCLLLIGSVNPDERVLLFEIVAERLKLIKFSKVHVTSGFPQEFLRQSVHSVENRKIAEIYYALIRNNYNFEIDYEILLEIAPKFDYAEIFKEIIAMH
ncbi:MAG: hypothetical protein MUO31_07120 [Thermodesulfovibrionales bacterium]|nr:hypothetical protein [Thermodesulfovibrionales bacterium]